MQLLEGFQRLVAPALCQAGSQAKPKRHEQRQGTAWAACWSWRGQAWAAFVISFVMSEARVGSNDAFVKHQQTRGVCPRQAVIKL